MAVFAELSYGGTTVRMHGAATGADAIHLASDGIEGWWSSPDGKVSMTERGGGDGAHAVDGSRVLYSARTVTVHLFALAGSRDRVLALAGLVSSAMGRIVRLRVVDGASDTYVEGYAECEFEAARHENAMVGTLTVVCPDPRRISTAAHGAFMSPYASDTDGLQWSDGGGLLIPLAYGAGGDDIRNVCTVENRGTATAYPRIVAEGDMDGLVITDNGTGRQIAYSLPVTAPVTFDSLTETASVNGVDTSRSLASRGFPTVPPGGTLTLSLHARGTGTVEVVSRDTYI